MKINNILWTFAVGGVPTTLASPPTVSVIRTDTSAVVFAGATTLTTATGVYTYAFTDPADGLTYRPTYTYAYGGATGLTVTEPDFAGDPGGTTLYGMTWGQIWAEVAFYRFNTRTPSAAQLAQAKTESLIGAGNFFSEREWSFLKPAETLAVANGSLTTDLPANYRSNCYNFHFDTPQYNIRRMEIDELIRLRTAVPNLISIVTHYAIRPKPQDSSQGQRFEILFYPLPQDDMTLACEYTINPTMPVNDSDYLPGGPLHDNAILFAALAYAEQIATKAAGPHTAQYNKLLASSIDRDAEVADTNLGYSCNGAGAPTLGEMYIEAERNAPWSYLGLP